MGVKNLWDILETCKKTLPLHHLQNKRVCIDLSCWMVQLHNVNKSHCSMKDKLYLKGLFHRIRALIGLNCSIIFVTDGSIPALKVCTYKRRLNLETEVAQDESSTNKVSSLRRNMGSEFSCMIKEAKILGAALGVPCLDGAEEGEAQCALLDSESLCDGCFSADSDIFLFGARTVYREICLGEGGYVICYEMADIERKLGFGRNSLIRETRAEALLKVDARFEVDWIEMNNEIALALLLGCDYSPGVHGLGPDSACQIVKALGESAVLQRIASEDLSLLKKGICSKKQSQVLRCNNKENIPPHETIPNGGKHNSQSNHQFLQVIDAYLKPKCHSADSETVHRVLGLYPFQRAKLQQTCSQFFEWPPEKTDEYILPKIAERDLRRFANLRSASSQLGVRLPLDEMPVKCPVSGIIKRRKVQGKECFEVSWEEIDGLGTSIVPSELIESACPEKVSEFEERLAEKKKPKARRPRLKKSGKNNESTNEVDTRLQELLLDIERDSCAAHTSRLHTGSPLSKTTAVAQVDQMNQELLLNTRSFREEVVVKENTTEDFSFTSSSFSETAVVNLQTPLLETKSKSKVETEVIDLLSPSPIVHQFSTSKCREENVSSIDVMDLSESETDVSPEHARKARELRQFVASIRDELS